MVSAGLRCNSSVNPRKPRRERSWPLLQASASLPWQPSVSLLANSRNSFPVPLLGWVRCRRLHFSQHRLAYSLQVGSRPGLSRLPSTQNFTRALRSQPTLLGLDGKGIDGRQTGNLMLSTYSQEGRLGWPNFPVSNPEHWVPENLLWVQEWMERERMGGVQSHGHGAKEGRNKETETQKNIEG